MSDLDRERWDVDFDVCKSIRYHSYRRSFWEMLDNCTKVLTVITGTAVFVSVVTQSPNLTLVFSAFVAISGALDLVLGFSNKMRAHDGLYRRFSRLAQDIAGNTSPTEMQVSQWRRERLEIEMDEPGTIRNLERRCAAEEAKARGAEVNPAWILTRRQIFFSQISIWPSIPN